MEHMDKAKQLYYEYTAKYQTYSTAQRDSFRRRVAKLAKQLTINDERHVGAVMALDMLATRMGTTFKFGGIIK